MGVETFERLAVLNDGDAVTDKELAAETTTYRQLRDLTAPAPTMLTPVSNGPNQLLEKDRHVGRA